MGTRNRNIRRAVHQHHRDRRLRELAVDPAKSEQVATAHREAIAAFRPLTRPKGVNLDGYPGPGDVNGYYCPDCRHVTSTVHVDRGVTPMFLACRATPDCHGRAVSMGYKATRDQLPPPAFEWYRPEGLQLRRLDFPMQDHIRQGGLTLREIAQ